MAEKREPTPEAEPYTRTLKPTPIREKDCPICQLPERKRLALEAAVYGLTADAGDNQQVAQRFGIGDGGPTSGEIVRVHRTSGHMRPRDFYEGRTLASLQAELEA